MQTLSGLMVFFGFYMMYYTSNKAPLIIDSNLKEWINSNSKQSKIIGATLLISAYIFLVFQTVLGYGSLLYFIEIMAFGGLIIILNPLNKINLKWILAFFSIAIILELLY